MTVGERIRIARKEKGLTQKALGEACGIAEPTIRRYELGKLNPKFETLGKIASALGVDIYSLLDFDSASDLLSDKINSALEKGVPDSLVLAYHQLNPVGQQKAVERVEELTEIPKYQRQTPENAGEAPNTPSEGKDTPRDN